MPHFGGLRENTRRNESLDRGTVSVTGSATVTVGGTPGPIRQVTSAAAWLEMTTAPADYIVTVGNIGTGGGNKANQFTIYTWKPTGGTTVAGTVTVPSAGAAASISVTSSPFTYTSAADSGEQVVLDANGATATYVVGRGAYTSAAHTLTSAVREITVFTGDTIVVTYSAATPNMEKMPFPAKPTVTTSSTGLLTLVAATDTVTCGWMAWGNLSAGQGF